MKRKTKKLLSAVICFIGIALWGGGVMFDLFTDRIHHSQIILPVLMGLGLWAISIFLDPKRYFGAKEAKN